jgi:hypothetical protein
MRELVSTLMNTPAFIAILGFSLIVIPILGVVIVVKDENSDGKL